MAAGNEVSRSHISVSPEMAEARDAMDEWVETNNLEALVAGFANALFEKLVAAEKKYNYEGTWKKDDWQDSLIIQLHQHVAKGDPLDVAAYCAFAWHHKWSLLGVVRTMDTALKDDFILLYVPSDYGWERGRWDGQQRCWVNRCGHAINPTHWTILPPEPQENA